MIRPNELVITDANFTFHAAPPPDRRKGLIPRDYQSFPRGHYASCKAVDVPLIDMSEWPDRIKDKVANKSQLSDIRLAGDAGRPIPSLDQDGVGYCWAHSSTSANMLLRALAGLPYVPLSAFAVAATIKKGADEGGWGAQSLDFLMARGQPSQAIWPQGDRNYSKYANDQACWDNAAEHRVTEGWIDLAVPEYDRQLSKQQIGTLLLSNVPVVADYNWWSHSVLAIDLLDQHPNRPATDPSRYGIRILNSWGDSWSDRGMGVLTDSKAWPDSAVAPRQSTVSMAA